MIKYGLDVPNTARAHLKTVRKVPLINRTLAYFGLNQGILSRVKEGLNNSVSNNCLSLQFNINGVPLHRSTNKSFWVIACRVVNAFNDSPFAVTVYFGNSKPNSAKTFLTSFITELRTLTVDGVIDNEGGKYSIKIESVICDAPARSFVKGIIGHTGLKGCKHCSQDGCYTKRRVIFPEVLISSDEIRTDHSFHTIPFSRFRRT